MTMSISNDTLTNAVEEKHPVANAVKELENSEEELEKAKALYYRYEKAQEWLQPKNSDGVKRTLMNEAYMPRFKGNPSWKYYVATCNDTVVAVDVDMTECVVQDFVPEENRKRYLETRDRRYRRSYTRYVYIRSLKDGNEEAYYMTIVPSVKYVEKYNDRMRRNIYLSRDNKLDGMVLFHTLTGMFVNGWQYSDGKIVVAAEPQAAVILKVEHQPVLAFAGEEGDGVSELLFDGGLLIGGEPDIEFGFDERHNGCSFDRI